jgi:hypothetical protein
MSKSIELKCACHKYGNGLQESCFFSGTLVLVETKNKNITQVYNFLQVMAFRYEHYFLGLKIKAMSVELTSFWSMKSYDVKEGADQTNLINQGLELTENEVVLMSQCSRYWGSRLG